MIIELATFAHYGYNSIELPISSHKPIVVKCDSCNRMRIVTKRDYRKHCKRCTLKGIERPQYVRDKISIALKGQKKTDEWKQKLSISHMNPSKETRDKISLNHFDVSGDKNPMFMRKHSEESKLKMRAARGRMPRKYTKPERIFIEICKKYNLPFKYTGDGSLWIKNINPDFVECGGKKTALEIFGDYWHSPLLNPKMKENGTLPYRKHILKKYGWNLIVFWETDILRSDADLFVMHKLKEMNII